MAIITKWKLVDAANTELPGWQPRAPLPFRNPSWFAVLNMDNLPHELVFFEHETDIPLTPLSDREDFSFYSFARLEDPIRAKLINSFFFFSENVGQTFTGDSLLDLACDMREVGLIEFGERPDPANPNLKKQHIRTTDAWRVLLELHTPWISIETRYFIQLVLRAMERGKETLAKLERHSPVNARARLHTPPSPERRNVFKKIEKGYEIWFEGHRLGRLKQLRGFLIIHRLLSRREEWLRPLDLEGHSAQTDNVSASALSMSEGLSVVNPNDAGSCHTDDQIRRIRNLIRSKEQELELKDDMDRKIEIEETIAKLKETLNIHGGARKEASENQKAQKRIDVALKSAFTNLRKQSEACAEHLHSSIKRDHYNYRYQPDIRIDWEL